MRNKRGSVLLTLGCVLLAGALCLLVGSRIGGHLAAKKALTWSAQLQALMPEQTMGVQDGRADAAMPVLQVDGVDFVGVLEVPAYGVTLPIASQWDAGRLSTVPCRYYGSVYDGSLIIGGSDQAGQFDFCDRIDIGQRVIVTDMTGARYTYCVRMVERTAHADSHTLLSDQDSLTLFARNAYGMEYILIRCVPAD